MATIQLDVKGMTCEHCVNAVTTACEDTDGVTSAQVNLDENAATVEGENVDIKALLAAIDEEGYEAVIRN